MKNFSPKDILVIPNIKNIPSGFNPTVKIYPMMKETKLLQLQIHHLNSFIENFL